MVKYLIFHFPHFTNDLLILRQHIFIHDRHFFCMCLTKTPRTCGPVDLQPCRISPKAWMWMACLPGGNAVAFILTNTGFTGPIWRKLASPCLPSPSPAHSIDHAFQFGSGDCTFPQHGKLNCIYHEKRREEKKTHSFILLKIIMVLPEKCFESQWSCWKQQHSNRKLTGGP